MKFFLTHNETTDTRWIMNEKKGADGLMGNLEIKSDA